jgi:hypothetical protein
MGLVRNQNTEYKKLEAMDTVRFSKIVEAAGKPDVHVLWIDPAKDSVLQKAIKANRVMTIHQGAGTKSDYGTVGFEKNASGQVLIFPKSLKSFENNRIVGVKYDLLESVSAPAPVPESQQSPKVQPAKSARRTKPKESEPKEESKPREIAEPVVEPPVAEESAHEAARVVKFPTPKVEAENKPNEELEEIKNQIREAIKILEEGKHVAAYNLLKRIAE